MFGFLVFVFAAPLEVMHVHYWMLLSPSEIFLCFVVSVSTYEKCLITSPTLTNLCFVFEVSKVFSFLTAKLSLLIYLIQLLPVPTVVVLTTNTFCYCFRNIDIITSVMLQCWSYLLCWNAVWCKRFCFE